MQARIAPGLCREGIMAVVQNLFVCTSAQVARCSFWEMYHREKEGNCSVLGELGDLFHCAAGCSWATAELQEPGTGTADPDPDPRPWWGAGSCHTSPWQGEPLLQPCSISHCFCGGQKADLGWEKTTSANKLLWPVPSICSLTFCRFWNSRC